MRQSESAELCASEILTSPAFDSGDFLPLARNQTNHVLSGKAWVKI